MPIVTVDGGQSSSAVAGRTAQYLGAIAAQQIAAAPDTLIQSQLYLTLRHFYSESTGWRAVVGPYPINAGVQNTYLNPVDQDTQLQYVLEAYLFPNIPNGNQKQTLPPSTRMVLTNVPGPPVSHFMVNSDQLMIQPVPDKTYGSILYVYAALCPTIGAVNLPDIAFTHHLDGILAGLFERMYRMPKKPWTDFNLSKMYGNMYKREILAARDFAIRGQGAADVPFVFPTFATSRMQGSQWRMGSAS